MKTLKISFIFLALCLFIFRAHGIAVMSIDLGSEMMKVAIVSPGIPMEIVLNKDSQRKTPVSVAFRDGERMFGDAASSIGVRFPDKIYFYMLDLLGKKIDNPIVKLFQKRFPHYKLTELEGEDSFTFEHSDGMKFTPQELIAMVLKQAKQIAQTAAGYPVKDAVITVPAFFNQAERRALMIAADLADINVLQLLNSNTAAALNYGVFRRKDFNESNAYNILFFDMGASSTVATIASYQIVKSKEKGFVESNPQLTIKGVGFDRTLGGLEMQLRLRDYLAKAFNEQKKTKNNVFKNKRSMSKLLKEAERVKKVLSANTEHIAQVENLLDDQDFRTTMSRQQLEELCEDMYPRIKEVVNRALQSSGMTMDEINQIILAGSGTRVPKVQQTLLEATGFTELGKSLNTDEAAALGAAYQAAHLSKGFKVKTFIVKEANIYPIQVDFQRDVELEDGTQIKKLVKRMLFSHSNPYPQKKVMTFSRHVKDFDFFVNFAELDFLLPHEVIALGSLNLTKVSILGLADTISKHNEETSEYKGVKAHFKLDESGLLKIEKVESVFEKKVEDDSEENKDDYGSRWSKLGDTIGKFFSGGATGETDTPSENSENTPSEEVTPPPTKEEKNETETIPEQNETKPVADDNQSNLTNKNESLGNETKKLKAVTVKETLESKKETFDFVDPPKVIIKASKTKLEELDAKDAARIARDISKNALESFILETKDKLYTPEYEQAITENDKEKYLKKLNEAQEYLEYESEEASTENFKDKLSALKELTRPMYERVKEHKARPEAMAAITDMLNISSTFLANARKMNVEDPIFTEVELNTLETLIKETNEWKTKSLEIQSATPLTETPKLTMKDIGEKITNLDREVKYLLNKARIGSKKKKVEDETKETKKDSKAPPPSPEEEKDSEEVKVEEEEEENKETPQLDGEVKDQPTPLDADLHKEL